MKRVLVVQGSLNPPGGSNGLAAWLLEALRDSHELTLLAWDRPRLEAVNAFFGTSLQAKDFALRQVSSRAVGLVEKAPVPGALLKLSLMTRAARALLAEGAFDLVISTQNEMDFGRRGVQYIHFPAGYLPRPECDLRWYHRLPFFLAAYRKLCDAVAGSSRDGIRANMTLANSEWTKKHFLQCYFPGGVEDRNDVVVVSPPVTGGFPERPWAERRDGFLCLGRLAPEKELEKVIAILEAVRERGHEIRLHLVGSPEQRPYARQIFELAAARRAWIELHLDLSRQQLDELAAANRYGLHGMVGEHFGMAVAELQRAGALVFVPSEGGPAEIVGGDDRLMYTGLEDAVEKISRVLRDEELRESIRRRIAERQELYSAERFMTEMRGAVTLFGNARAL